MKKARVILLIVMLLGLAVVASGCGPASRSERAIVDDLAEIDACIQEFNMEITGWTVDKRQTNVDDKTDYIWISINADCDYFSYTVDYTAEYVLYNDGWKLEDYTRVDYQYDQFDTVSETVVARDLAENEYRFSDLGLQVVGQTMYARETDPEQKTDVISIWVDYDCEECSVSVNYIATYWLDSDGWHYAGASFKDFDYVGKSSILQQEVVDSEAETGIGATYEGFHNITFERRIERTNEVDFYYSAHKTIPYFDATGEFCVTYAYVLSPESGFHGWRLKSVHDGKITGLETDLVGTWSYRDNDMELTVNILSAEVSIEDDAEGRVSCDFECTYSMTGLPVYWHKKNGQTDWWGSPKYDTVSEPRNFIQTTPVQIHFWWWQEEFLTGSERNYLDYGKLFEFYMKSDWVADGETSRMELWYSDSDSSYSNQLSLEYWTTDYDNDSVKIYPLKKV